jgi:hypothetical protein
VKAILTKCIEGLALLKAQVRKLQAYFDAMAKMVDYVEEHQLNEFVGYIDGTLPADDKPFVGYNVIDITRQFMFNAVVLVRAWYGLFEDIAQMWVDISAKHLIQGSALVDTLGQEIKKSDDGDGDGGGGGGGGSGGGSGGAPAEDPSQSKALLDVTAKLETWTTEAVDAVAKIAEDVCLRKHDTFPCTNLCADSKTGSR